MTGKKGVSGRKSIKGFLASKSNQKRNSYTLQFKQSVLESYEAVGVAQTILKFWPELDPKSNEREIKRKLIYKWKKFSAKIAETATSNNSFKKVRPMGTSSVLSTEVEDEIYFWVRTLHKEGIFISYSTLRTKALEICQQHDCSNFFASSSWMKNFKNKYGLKLQTKSQGETTVIFSNSAAEQFVIGVKNKMLELGVNCVWNGDQSALFYETFPGLTPDETRTIFFSSDTFGKETEIVSVLVLASSTGEKRNPFMIFKEQASNEELLKKASNQRSFGTSTWNRIQDVSKTRNSQVYCNRSGWFTNGVIVEWLYSNFSCNIATPKILLMDDFPAHWTDEVIATANLLNITLIKIPFVLTSICQPADISWNRSYQSCLKENWAEQSKINMADSEVLFKEEAFSRENLIQSIDAAWESLSSTTIISGFLKPGYIAPSENDFTK